MPLPRSLNWRPDCAPSGTLTLDSVPSSVRDGKFAAERRLHHRDRDPAIEIGAVALEDRVRLDGEENIEVARRAAAHSGLALAGETNAGAVLDAGGNVDRQRALPGHPAGAGAFVARISIVCPRP